MKSTLVSNLSGVIGQQRIIPLYNGYGGNGSHTYYNIVGFAGVTIVDASGHGDNLQITLQPAIVTDPTAVSSPSSGPGAITGGSKFVYTSAALTN